MPGRTSFQKEGPADTQHKGVSRRREGGPLGPSQPRPLSCAEGQGRRGGVLGGREEREQPVSCAVDDLEPTDVKAGHLDAE